MTPRLTPPARLDELQREALARTVPGSDGNPLNVFATLAHRPRLLRHLSALGGYFPLHSNLTTRDRELVTLRVAVRCRAAYVEAHHRVIAARDGVPDEEIAAAADPTAAQPWDRRDAALLRFADELVEDHVVSDATWDALDGHLDDEQRMELLVLVGFYALFSGLTTTLRIDEDAFRSGPR